MSGQGAVNCLSDCCVPMQFAVTYVADFSLNILVAVRYVVDCSVTWQCALNIYRILV